MTKRISSDFIEFTSGNRVTKLLYAFFGSLLNLLGVLILVVTRSDFAGFVLALLVITLPCCGFGTYFLITLQRLLKASVIVCQDWIELNIPDFRAGWLFKGVPVQLRWDQIEAVTHDRYAFMEGAKPIDIYSIASNIGVFTLTKDVCSDPIAVARIITERINSSVHELAIEEPQQPPIKTPEQEETELKNKAIIALVMLFITMWFVLAIVLTDTPFMHWLQRGLTVIDNILLFVTIVTLLSGIFRLWFNSRRNRASINQRIKAVE